jgi:GNAT superfamily N-acetyltransferase
VTSRSIPPDAESELRAKVLESLRRTLGSLAKEMLPVKHGWVLRTPSLPQVWSLNQFRVADALTPADAVVLAEEYQIHQSFRHVVLEDVSAVDENAEQLGADWQVNREVLMTLAGGADRDADANAVIELSEEQGLALMRRWAAEDHPEISTEGLEQLEEYNRREGRLWSERRFGVLGDDGNPAAMTKFRSDGSTGWIEDVYTVPEARGRGFARTLVTHATRCSIAANNDVTFIIADDNDWPKHLYAKIGFRPIGKLILLHRAVRSEL